MLTFKNYFKYQKTPIKLGSIQHFEDVPLKEKMFFMEHLSDFSITEKLDGTSFDFGIDSEGLFFTSRYTKGNANKIYDPLDWGESGASNVFRTAHNVLSQYAESFKNYLTPDITVSVEILYGKQSNVVVYGKDDLSYIAILDIVGYDGNSVTLIDKILDATNKKIITINDSVLFSSDGKSLQHKSIISKWKLIKSPTVDIKQIQALKFGTIYNEMKKYLDADNETLHSYEATLTNMDVYNKDDKDLDKKYKKMFNEEYDIVFDIVNDYLTQIKNVFVEYVTHKKSALGTNDSSGIEGIVCTNYDTGVRFKIVDKNEFTNINKFYHQVRDMVKSSIKTDDEAKDIILRGGIYGNMRIRIAKLFNVDGMSNSKNLKKIFRKFKMENYEATIKNFVSSLRYSDNTALQKKIYAVINTTITELDESLNTFKTTWKDYTYTYDGKEVKYNEEIYNRTLLHYAETYKNMSALMESVKKPKSMIGLVHVLFGKKIEEVQNEE